MNQSPTTNEMMKMLNASLSRVSIDNEMAFKSECVTNALDGSEEYLVSDRIFRLVGESMREFRSSMIEAPVPKTIKEVIRKIIPPKGIKRNIEGSELIDGDEIAESDVPDDESDSDQDVDASQLLEAFDGEIDIKANETLNEMNTVSGGMVSLVGTIDNKDIKKDAEFVDAISRLLDEYQTSLLQFEIK